MHEPFVAVSFARQSTVGLWGGREGGIMPVRLRPSFPRQDTAGIGFRGCRVAWVPPRWCLFRSPAMVSPNVRWYDRSTECPWKERDVSHTGSAVYFFSIVGTGSLCCRLAQGRRHVYIPYSADRSARSTCKVERGPQPANSRN